MVRPRPDEPVPFTLLRAPPLPPRSLPAQPTPLIGRDREVALVRGLLRRAEVRLVTLTGPAGIGKTRLALAAAECLLDETAHGACFVDLAPIGDPALVVPAYYLDNPILLP